MPLLLHRSQANEQYVSEVRSAYRGLKLYDPDYALSQDPAIWTKMLRDPVIRHAVQQRLNAIAGRKWQMRPPSDEEDDKRAATIMEELVRKVRKFTSGRYQLAQGVFKGRSYAFVNGERRLLQVEDLMPRRWWVPTLLDPIDERRIRFEPEWCEERGRRWVRRRLMIGNIDTRGPRWFEPSREDLLSIVRVVYADEEERLGHGRGLRESMYFYFYAIWKVLQEGMQGVERWAQGYLVGKVKRTGAGPKSNAEVADEMLDRLEKMRSRNILVVDSEDDLQAIFPSGTGHQMVIDFLRYLHDKVTQLIVGSLLHVGSAGDVGSAARAETEADTSEGMIQFDREVVDEALTETLVAQTWRLNHANFLAVGLGGARMPSFATVQDRREDPEKAANVASTLLNAGVVLKRREVMEKTGYTIPEKNPETGEWEDDVVEGASTGGGLDGGGGLAALLGQGGLR